MLIRSIEKFLHQHHMPPTKFGRLAAHDPRFVLDLRMGRTPREATEKRIRAWMENYRRDESNRAKARGGPRGRQGETA